MPTRTSKFAIERGHEKLYKNWSAMRGRCSNPRATHYARYGGRGISVCAEWQSFPAFSDWAIATGWRQGLTIERKDNDRGYSPDNCTWATPYEQSLNRGCVAKAPDGTPYIVIAVRNGIKQSTYRNRLAIGWTRHDAATFPSRGYGNRRPQAMREAQS